MKKNIGGIFVSNRMLLYSISEREPKSMFGFAVFNYNPIAVKNGTGKYSYISYFSGERVNVM